MKNQQHNHAAEAAQSDVYEKRPGRTEHLAKIALTTAPVEMPAAEPQPSPRTTPQGERPSHSSAPQTIGSGR